MDALYSPIDVRRHPMLFVAAATAAGVVVGRYAPGSVALWGTAAGMGLAVWWLVLRAGRQRAATFLLLLDTSFMSAAWTDTQWRLFPSDELGLSAPREDHPIVLEARLRTAPRWVRQTDPWAPGLGDYTVVEIDVLRVRDGRTWRAASGRARAAIRGTLQGTWDAGDVVRMYARYRAIETPMNPGEFNRAAFFRGQRQLFQVQLQSEAALQRRSAASPWSIRCRLERLRAGARDVLRQHIDPPWDGLAAALLLGAREQLDRQILEPFLQTGTVHVLAISGLHLGMLVYGIFLAMRLGWLSRRCALWLAIVAVVPYAVLTSGHPPVVRAAMLAVGAGVARLTCRPYSTWNLLGTGAVLVLIMNPLQLFQAGVQLSFLAVAALVAAPAAPGSYRTLDPLQQLMDRARSPWHRAARQVVRHCWSAWWSGCIVWLVTLPLIILRFHRASPVAVLMNPILWFPLAGALLSGFLLLLTAGELGPVSRVPAAICQRCLQGTYEAICWSDRWTGAHVWLPAPPWLLVLCFYLALLLLLWVAGSPRMRRAAAVLLTAAILVAVFWCAVWMPLRQRPGGLRITFFAVGHGTCVVIHTPEGRVWLYDAGRFGSPRSLVDYVTNTLWTRGIRRIDLALISHADSDHFNGLPGILERIRVREVGVPCSLGESTSPLALTLHDQLQRSGIEQRVFAAGERIVLRDQVCFELLHPPMHFPAESDNARSLVLLIRYAGRAVLLPGDLEGNGLGLLLRQSPPAVDVVMAPHHGSRTSNSEAWAAWARAPHVVISGDGPVLPATLAAYEKVRSRVWNTYESGAVDVLISPTGDLRIRPFTGAFGHRFAQRAAAPSS